LTARSLEFALSPLRVLLNRRTFMPPPEPRPQPLTDPSYNHPIRLGCSPTRRSSPGQLCRRQPGQELVGPVATVFGTHRHRRPGRRRSCPLPGQVASEARHYCGAGSGQPLSVRRPGMPKARSGPTDQARRQQESRSVSTSLTGPGSQVSRCAVPDAYTFADDAHGLSRLRLRRPRPRWSRPVHIDVCSMFARTPRYAPALLGIRRAARMRAIGHNGSSWHVLALFDSSSRRISEQSSGLLIRGFGVRVPGGAPVQTWRFCHLFSLIVSHLPAMVAPRLLVSPNIVDHGDRTPGEAPADGYTQRDI